jgi:signal transduction histidine kinase
MVETASNRVATVSYTLPRKQAEIAATVSGDAVESAREESLLRENALWFCRLRWMVVGLLLATGVAGSVFRELFAQWGLQRSPTWLLLAALVLAIANRIYVKIIPSGTSQTALLTARTQLWIQIVVDLLILTAVIHFLGGSWTNAPFTYLFHIVLACIFFRPLESFSVTAVAAGFYVGLLLLEGVGMAPPVTDPGNMGLMGSKAASLGFRGLAVSSTLVTWTIIWYLVSRLADTLRQRERELATTNLRLKASSDERMKHMLQTTHQLKAPFAAIHANTQLLLKGYCGMLPERAVRVAEKIAVRCATLSEQIQSMLQLANLRSTAQLAPPNTQVDLAALIRKSVDRTAASAAQRRIHVEADLKPLSVQASEDHMVMLIDNVVTNAVNYSKDGGLVNISCTPGPDDSVVVMVRDHGIGIAAEKLPKIFDDYYRTEEAAKHCRMSTGLGLAIVRDAAIASSVEVRVESAPDWGTRFWLTVPGKPERVDSKN